MAIYNAIQQVTVRNMNTVIAIEEITEEINSINKAREILMKHGFSSKNLLAKTKDHTIYWDSKDYIVVLVNEKTQMIIYPTVIVFNNTSNRYMNLSIVLPNAGLMDLGKHEIELDLQEYAGSTFENSTIGNIELDKGVQLSVDEDNLGEEETLSWHADFTITFNKSFNTYIDDGLSDGEVGFILAGSYDAFQNGDWIPLLVLNAEANKPIRILQELLAPMLGLDGTSMFLTYRDIVTYIPNFKCGIKAVYDNALGSNTFNMNEQNYDDLDKIFLDGLEVTIELRLYEIDKAGQEIGESHIIETIVHNYNIE